MDTFTWKCNLANSQRSSLNAYAYACLVCGEEAIFRVSEVSARGLSLSFLSARTLLRASCRFLIEHHPSPYTTSKSRWKTTNCKLFEQPVWLSFEDLPLELVLLVVLLDLLVSSFFLHPLSIRYCSVIDSYTCTSTGFGGAPGAGGGNGGKNQEDQAAQQEEMKRQMLSRILDAEARERRKFHSPLFLLCSFFSLLLQRWLTFFVYVDAGSVENRLGQTSKSKTNHRSAHSNGSIRSDPRQNH